MSYQNRNRKELIRILVSQLHTAAVEAMRYKQLQRQLIAMSAEYFHVCLSLKAYFFAISIRPFREGFIQG
jgi:hypothetical protein